MINWPDIKFPPINLYSMPPQESMWARKYHELEYEYCKDLQDQYDEAREHTLDKKILKEELETKRKEFNKLWNRRAGG